MGWLLTGVSLVILVLPVGAVLVFRVFQNILARETETDLIAQSIVIGEMWRDRWIEEGGGGPNCTGDVMPRDSTDDEYAPVDAVLDLGREVLPPLADPSRHATTSEGPAWRAGARIAPALARSRAFSLSSARVLDAEGCVVAASGTWLGACLDDLPEVRSALAGRYSAVARRRVSDSPEPPLASISRGGDIRIFTALPVWSGGEVVAVVWMSRTSIAPHKAAWLYRRPLLLGLVASLVLAAAISLFLARSISAPLRRITRAAESVSRGGPPGDLEPGGFAPAEVHVLGAVLSTMTEQLSSRAAYISEFAANVSHELKSPITAIRGASELLLEEADQMPPDRRRRFLENIVADASRMERLVARLLELARIQSAPAQSGAVDVVALLERVAEPYAGQVVVDAGQAPRTIGMNEDHLESAVRNLVENAVRHGRDERVEVTARVDGDRLAISVRDRGPGIPERDRERVFDRFFTTERDSGGTGLGLAIVRAVAETRGGEVVMETGPDGTTITLVI